MNIDVCVVMWCGTQSDGHYWAMVHEKFNGRSEARGYQCKMDCIEDCVKAFRSALIERLNDAEKPKANQ